MKWETCVRIGGRGPKMRELKSLHFHENRSMFCSVSLSCSLMSRLCVGVCSNGSFLPCWSSVYLTYQSTEACGILRLYVTNRSMYVQAAIIKYTRNKFWQRRNADYLNEWMNCCWCSCIPAIFHLNLQSSWYCGFQYDWSCSTRRNYLVKIRIRTASCYILTWDTLGSHLSDIQEEPPLWHPLA